MRKSLTKEHKPSKTPVYQALFWLFFFGSVIGFVLEGIWQIIKKGHWENHTATILGPFCIIYGIAAALLYFSSIKLRDKNIFILFLIFAFFGSLLELLASIFQELVFGSISWNYKKQLLNLGGRISLKMSVIWGVLGVAFTKILYPLFSSVLERMCSPVWTGICILLSLFMIFNLLVSSVAVSRWGERVKYGMPAESPIEQFFDDNYDNETLDKMFSNMVFIKENND